MDETACKIVVIAKTKRVIIQTVPVYQDALRVMKEKRAKKRHVHIVINGQIYIYIDLTMIDLLRLLIFNDISYVFFFLQRCCFNVLYFVFIDRCNISHKH